MRFLNFGKLYSLCFRLISNIIIKAPYMRGLKQEGVSIMFLEYLTDMSFVLIILVGSIIALLFAFMRKSRKRRAR
ncbi:EYxxD motif small membrane protein [Bacillus sp. JJ1532]|uniref:EYxxD motif small membrane protein n=1 Tax=Bacillus sp. JJ1532 TaxID=3122958 RepID=UPI002FFF38D4